MTTSQQIDAAAERLRGALKTLRDQAETIPIERARVIAASASNIIESLKVEAQLSTIAEEEA